MLLLLLLFYGDDLYGNISIMGINEQRDLSGENAFAS